jgi:hypothetical protein
MMVLHRMLPSRQDPALVLEIHVEEYERPLLHCPPRRVLRRLGLIIIAYPYHRLNRSAASS